MLLCFDRLRISPYLRVVKTCLLMPPYRLWPGDATDWSGQTGMWHGRLTSLHNYVIIFTYQGVDHRLCV